MLNVGFGWKHTASCIRLTTPGLTCEFCRHICPVSCQQDALALCQHGTVTPTHACAKTVKFDAPNFWFSQSIIITQLFRPYGTRPDECTSLAAQSRSTVFKVGFMETWRAIVLYILRFQKLCFVQNELVSFLHFLQLLYVFIAGVWNQTDVETAN